jgi:hypothetical protein
MDIRIDTFGALLEREYELHVRCSACDRWGRVDLEKLVLLGHRDCRFAGATFTCVRCGRSARELQIRPPQPTRAVHGWPGLIPGKNSGFTTGKN